MRFSTKVKSLLYSLEFSHGVRRALMSTLIVVYFLSFGFDIISITSLLAVSTLIMTFFEFPTGAIADYDSRKKSIMIGFLGLSIAFFGLFLFKSFWLLSISWILADIAWTFCSGAQGAWAIDALAIGKKKSEIVSLISGGYFFEKGGHIIGGLIGLVIIAINFSFIWLFISVWYLMMFFIIWKYMEERNFKPEKVPHNYLVKALIKAKESILFILHKKNKHLRVLMLGDFLGILAGSAFFVCMPLFFTQNLGLNADKLSGIVAIASTVTIIGPLVAKKIAHLKGFRGPLVFFMGLQSILFILFSLSHSLVFSIALLALLHCVFAIISVVGDSAYHHEFDSKIRASLGSANSVMWAIGNSIAVFLTGISIKFLGVIPTVIISGLLFLAGALIYFGGLRKD